MFRIVIIKMIRELRKEWMHRAKLDVFNKEL